MNNTANFATAQQQTKPALSEFLAAFFPNPTEPIRLRAFAPHDAPESEFNHPVKICTTRGELSTDKELKQRLKWLNKNRGLYFVVNAGGDEDKDINRYNSFFVESDTLPIDEQHARLNESPILPSVRIETKKSIHAYWLLSGKCTEEEWRDIQARLIDYFDGDKKIKNPSRPMRLPYLNHVTYNGEDKPLTYKRVEIAEFESSRRYTVAEMQAALPPTHEHCTPAQQKNDDLTIDNQDPNADLKRLIMARGLKIKKGAYEMRCPAHNGKSNTSLVLLLNGAFACLKEPPCTTAEIRLALGLPTKHLPSSNSSIHHTTQEAQEDDSLYSSSLTLHSVTPKLSEKALHGLAGDIVRAIEPHSEADPAALLIQTLVGFGNIIGRTAHFIAEADSHYMNLFTVIVGSSSRGRKGSSWGHVRRLLEAVDDKWASCIVGGLSSGEGLIHHVRDDEASPNADKRALVIETEFASVLRVQKRESNTLSTTLRQAWDTGDLNVMRRNNPDKARGAHISIVGHITGDELKRCLQETDAVNGYANRFLWVHAQRSKKLPEGGHFNKSNVAPLILSLRKAVEFSCTVGEMERDTEAAALWREIYNALDEEADGQVAAILSRAEAQIMRLACIYALLDRSDIVKRIHLEAAKDVWDYCAASASYVFGGDVLSAKARKLLKQLRENGDAGLNRTDIYKKSGGKLKADELDTLLTQLASAGLVHATSKQTDRTLVRGRESGRDE